jgi:hypothetical protein
VTHSDDPAAPGLARARDAGLLPTLASDRRDIAALMAYTLEYAAIAGVEVLRELYPTIRKELLAHSRALRKALYDGFFGDRGPQCELTLQCIAEHDALERRLRRLDQLDVESPLWMRKLQALERTVKRLAELEETRVSAVLSEELDPESARRVKRCYLEDKRERLERLSRPGLDLAAG